MTKIIAVVLDDEPSRHIAFKHRFKKDFRYIESCYNTAQFLHFMLTYPGHVDYVTLDHDLGNEAVCGTGFDGARLLATLPQVFRPSNVNVHSFNAPKALEMQEFLVRNGYPDATRSRYSET